MRLKYRQFIALFAGSVIALGLVGAPSAEAKTPPTTKPSKTSPAKARLLPANLSCAGLLTAGDWGPYVREDGGGPGPCIFAVVLPTPPPPTPVIQGGELACSAVAPAYWTSVASHKNGGNLLPKTFNDGDGPEGPDSRPHIGTRAEVFLENPDLDSNPPEQTEDADLQVRNAVCTFLVIAVYDHGGTSAPLLSKTLTLMRIVAAELGG
jgi:hypothetical protein